MRCTGRVSDADDPGQRRAPSWLPFAAAAALVVVVAVVAVLLRSVHRGDGFSLATSSTIPSGHAAAAVVHDGERVRASGTVVVGPGRAARFCGPVAEAARGQRAPVCRPAVVLDGIDPTRLTGAHTRSGRTVGQATITGVYRHGRIQVDRQAGYRPRPDPLHALPPCAAPDSGWPPGPAVDRRLPAVQRYEHRHPGAVLVGTVLHPSRGRSVVYVITSGNPNPVGDALLPVFGKRLCVARSPYSPAEIAAARRLLAAHLGTALTDVTSTGGPTADDHGRLEVPASVPVLTSSFAHQVDGQPAGLIQLKVWLRPSG